MSESLIKKRLIYHLKTSGYILVRVYSRNSSNNELRNNLPLSVKCQ